MLQFTVPDRDRIDKTLQFFGLNIHESKLLTFFETVAKILPQNKQYGVVLYIVGPVFIKITNCQISNGTSMDKPLDYQSLKGVVLCK